MRVTLCIYYLNAVVVNLFCIGTHF